MKKYLILLVVFKLIFAQDDRFNEELLIETLPNSNLHFYFQFTTISKHNLIDESSCKLNIFNSFKLS
jgi:hypothetical protein